MKNILYLLLSVSLSAGRNIATKKTAMDNGVKSQFFLSQSLLFGSATVLFFIFAIKGLTSVSTQTITYGVIYGVLLILSQWMFTLSLKSGATAICSVIYSLGFILPTVSGALFWDEPFTFIYFLGIIIAVIVILLAAKKDDKKQKAKTTFVPFIIVAMLSSGGLGIMQKVQQNGDAAKEKSVFLFIAFLLAFVCSFVSFLVCRNKVSFEIKKAVYPAFTGLCFGGANLCNTILAGRMDSAVFFPIQNISTILCTTLLGLLLFKEKITKRTLLILSLGVVIILIFTFF